MFFSNKIMNDLKKVYLRALCQCNPRQLRYMVGVDGKDFKSICIRVNFIKIDLMPQKRFSVCTWIK